MFAAIRRIRSYRRPPAARHPQVVGGLWHASVVLLAIAAVAQRMPAQVAPGGTAVEGSAPVFSGPGRAIASLRAPASQAVTLTDAASKAVANRVLAAAKISGANALPAPVASVGGNAVVGQALSDTLAATGDWSAALVGVLLDAYAKQGRDGRLAVDAQRMAVRQRASRIEEMADQVRSIVVLLPPAEQAKLATILAAAVIQVTDHRELARELPPARLSRVGLGWRVIGASSPQAACYWGQRSRTLGADVTVGALTGGGSEGGVVSADVFADYWKGIRVAFTTAVASAASTPAGPPSDPALSTDTDANTLRFIEGGGTFGATVAYPLLWNTSQRLRCAPPDGSPATPEEVTSFQLLAAWRVGADVGGVGEVDTDPATNTDFGIEQRIAFGFAAGRFTIFAQAREAFVVGTTAFYNNIGHAERKPFGYVQLQGGITLLDAVRIQYAAAPAGPGVIRDRMKHLLSVSLKPKR